MNDATIWISSITGLVGAIIGAVGSPWLISFLNNSGNRKVRKLCVKALEILKKKGKFSSAKNEFNSGMTTSEKRAILVCLHKIGVPIAATLNGKFNFNDVTFLDNEVIQSEIQLMKQQVNDGICDNYFFMDADKYFSENLIIETRRSIAKKYVNEVMTKTTMTDTTTFSSKNDWGSIFTQGELNVIWFFRKYTASPFYYNEKTKIMEECKRDNLIKEIDIGLWDNYLQWDNQAFENMIAQKNAADYINSLATDRNEKPAIQNQINAP